ncbi:hypothetical protein M0R19_04035 [Candidatus Pacearchaeota archaeon]|jgi:hypothetical protein|nr:hypothetical protein [Candidatus Pacearchaeota archaeon]
MINFEYNTDCLVLGATYQSVLYSFYNYSSIIFLYSKKPFCFKKENDENEERALRYSRIMNILSLKGKVFGTVDGVNFICIEIDKQRLLVVLKNNKEFYINYKKLVIFDETDIKGIEQYKKEDYINDKNIVVYNFGFKNYKDYLKNPKEIKTKNYELFHILIESQKNFRVLAYLTDEQILDENFDGASYKIRVEAFLKERNIRGKLNPVKTFKKDGSFVRSWYRENLSTTYKGREIYQTTRNYFENIIDKNIEFNYDSIEDMEKRYL